MTDKPTAFVVMPFDEEFAGVYESFMKPLLEDAVFRADDIESQRNILRDILDMIQSSDLIVADLTSANPNVFYELGLAHALRKPVILATQSIDEVPFDLTSYRLLEYDTHFTRIDDARTKLASYAKGFLEGEIQFGNPVTDFLGPGVNVGQEPRGGSEAQEGDPVPSPTDSAQNKTTPEDERGYLDHLIDITNGYNSMAETIRQVGEAQGDMNRSIEGATADFNRIAANSSASSPAAVRTVSRRLADQIGAFNSRLKQANDEYASTAQEIEDSLEFAVSFQLEQSDEANPQVVEQLCSLRDLRSVVVSARDSYLDLAKTMDALPRLERRLNREVARGSKEVRAMANNMDRTIASISRALRDR